jgi:hypothetical protein
MLHILLAAAAATSPVCAKLTDDFDKNERAYAFMYDMNADLLEIDKKYQRDIAPYRQEVAIAEARARALGSRTYSRDLSSNDPREAVGKAQQKLEQTDARYKAEGDRIVTLIIANKCPPPDHVTSWYTYSKKNPEAAK